MTQRKIKSLAKEIAGEILKNKDSALQNHTVQDAFDYYFNTKKVKGSTIANKQTLLEQLAKHGYNTKPISEMTGAVQREFFSTLNMSDVSTHVAYTRLQAVLKHYVKDHNLPIELPKGLYKAIAPKKSEQDEFLTWSELQSLLLFKAVTDEKNQFFVDLFCLMALTGMALADIMRFQPNVSVQGKWLKYTRVKTGSACTVPLLPVAKEIIDRNEWPIKVSRRTIQYKCEGVISDLVGRKIKSHGARKTFGAICLEWGYSLESVAKFMGHSNPLLTAKVYAHVTEAKIEREMNDMPPAVKQLMGI